MAANIQRTGQLVTFRLGGEIYGIEIFKVQEVLHYRKVTSIPNSPEFVEGVIHVRDTVIPVVDLRLKLGFSENGSKSKRLVVLDYEDRLLGVIVDDISKVITLDESRFEDLPEAVEDGMGKSCISGLARTEDDNLIIIINPDLILSRTEKKELNKFQDMQEKERSVA